MIWLIVATVLVSAKCIDVQMQLQLQAQIDYLSNLIKSNSLEEFEQEKWVDCLSEKCCVCGRQFKNSSYSAVHINMHHQHGYHQSLQLLLDEQISQQDKYKYCMSLELRVSLEKEEKESLCVILSQGMMQETSWIKIVKYLLYIVVSIVVLFYYSDLYNSMDRDTKKHKR